MTKISQVYNVSSGSGGISLSCDHPASATSAELNQNRQSPRDADAGNNSPESKVKNEQMSQNEGRVEDSETLNLPNGTGDDVRSQAHERNPRPPGSNSLMEQVREAVEARGVSAEEEIRAYEETRRNRTAWIITKIESADVITAETLKEIITVCVQVDYQKDFDVRRGILESLDGVPNPAALENAFIEAEKERFHEFIEDVFDDVESAIAAIGTVDNANEILAKLAEQNSLPLQTQDSDAEATDADAADSKPDTQASGTGGGGFFRTLLSKVTAQAGN